MIPSGILFQGFMAYIGGYKSLLDTNAFKNSGIVAWLAWRSVYLTRLGSMKNKLQVGPGWDWGTDRGPRFRWIGSRHLCGEEVRFGNGVGV